MSGAPARLGWDEIFDPAKSGWDSIVPFLGVAQLLAADAKTIVDLGCGRGAQVDGADGQPFQDLRGPGRRVVGLDVDPVGDENPILDEFRLIEDGSRWPLADGEVDLVVSDFTFEHIDDPQTFVAELTRVLRPGGVVVARTVSRYSPLALSARTVPNRRHAGVLSRLQPARQARDVFPTRYRMNTERDLRALFERDFDWTVAHRGGLDQYVLPWPRLARAVAAVEPRLPKATQTALVIYARKR